MYKEKFLDLFRHVPAGVWLLAFGLSVQFSPVLTFTIKGGGVICCIYAIGMMFCRSRFCRTGFGNAVSAAVRENGGLFALLAVFYVIAVAAWFYAPYEISYNDIRHVWKKMALNVVAIFIGMFLSRYPHFIKTFVLLCIPCALFQTGLMSRVAATEGMEARSFLGESGAGGFLGAFTQWEAVAMLSVMLFGLMMTIKNKVAKVSLGVLILFFAVNILRAGYATPFALLLIGFGMIGLGYMRFGSSKRTNAAMKIAISVLFVLGAAFVFYKVAKSAETGKMASESVATRFYAFMLNPSGGGYDVEHSRFRAMYIAWDSFCKSPIFGRGGEYPSPHYDVSAGHHALVDYLGHYGLIGGGSYLLFVLLTMRYLFKRYRRTRDWFDSSKMAVSVMFFVGGVVNPGWLDLPMSCYLIFCAPFVNRTGERAERLASMPYPPQMYF